METIIQNTKHVFYEPQKMYTHKMLCWRNCDLSLYSFKPTTTTKPIISLLSTCKYILAPVTISCHFSVKLLQPSTLPPLLILNSPAVNRIQRPNLAHQCPLLITCGLSSLPPISRLHQGRCLRSP